MGAGDLQAGQRVWQADGEYGAVLGVEFINTVQRMYNLTVAEAHTFFVGRTAWLVHNCEPKPKRPGQHGNPDHQATVAQLETEARSEFQGPDYTIFVNKKISSHSGSDLNRIPDVWVKDNNTNMPIKIYEAARTLANGVDFVPREIKKMIEYASAGIKSVFRRVGPQRFE